MESTVSPYLKLKSSRSVSGKSAAISRKNRQSLKMGTTIVEQTDGVPFSVEKTNPRSLVTLSRKPYSLDPIPSLDEKNTMTGIESALIWFMHRKNSVDEISFLLMAREIGIPTATFWAKKLGLKYTKAFAKSN